MRDRIVRAAECVANEITASTWPETEYRLDMCRAINGAHTDIYWAHKELCEIQCSKMYRFLQDTSRLKKQSDLLCCSLRLDTLYLVK